KIETGMHMRKNTSARLRRKDRVTLSIDSDKATEENWNVYKEDSELDLFILEEGAKGLLKDLKSKHSEAHIEEETVLHQDLESIKKDLEYEPIKEIEEDWYKELLKTVEVE
ncbi:1750_t:CDS:2, partial [Gigaspora rosea]